MLRFLTFLLLLSTSGLSADEWWAWSHVEFWKVEPWSAGVFLGNRLDVDDGAYVQIVSPRLKYQLLPWLETGLGLSVLSIENTSTHLRKSQFRPELELNPKFDLSPTIRVEMRNRMEWRENEGESLTQSRSRHRLQLAANLPNPVGPISRLFVSNEWLVDLHRQRWTENRLVPMGVTFNLTGRSDLDLFYMLLSQDTQKGWHSESVLGTYLRFRF
jgi:hypothetical protein